MRLARHDHAATRTQRIDQGRSYGEGTYQALRNDWYRNTRDNFLVELGKHGLGKRDHRAERP